MPKDVRCLIYSCLIFLITLFVCALWVLDAQAKTVGYILQWDANSEPDLAGYKIYIGTTSRNYGQVIIPTGDKALATTYEGTLDVPDNTETTYYFAVTAYDTAGLESEYSNEVFKEVDNKNKSPSQPKNLNWVESISWLKSFTFEQLFSIILICLF